MNQIVQILNRVQDDKVKLNLPGQAGFSISFLFQ